MLNTRYKFIFNASYNQYVTDRGQSYSTFLSNYNGPPLNAGASGSAPALIVQQPSQTISLAPKSLLGQTLLDSHQPTPTEFIPYQPPQPPFHPNTPPNQRPDLTTPTRPIPATEIRSDQIVALNLKSRLAIKNIALLKTAIESNEETSDVTLESDLFLNRLEKKTNWNNRDIGLLLLAMSGVIPIVEPTGQVAPPSREALEEGSDLEIT